MDHGEVRLRVGVGARTFNSMDCEWQCRERKSFEVQKGKSPGPTLAFQRLEYLIVDDATVKQIQYQSQKLSPDD